jgi:hypothetical protein
VSHHQEIRAAEPLVARYQQRLYATLHELQGPMVAEAARSETARHVLENLVLVTRAERGVEQAQTALARTIGIVARGSSVREILIDLVTEARGGRQPEPDRPPAPAHPSDRPTAPPPRVSVARELNVSTGHRESSPPGRKRPWPF